MMYRSTCSTAEPLDAPRGLGGGVLAARIELGRQEHLLARDAAVAQRAPDAGLVAVRLGRVDVPVAGLERPAHGVLGLRAVGHLPDAEAEHGDPRAVGEGASGFCCACRWVLHAGLLEE